MNPLMRYSATKLLRVLLLTLTTSNSWVSTSPAKVFFQETPAKYRTLTVRQNEYYPQVFRWVEGC
jgi:hypothetical protein